MKKFNNEWDKIIEDEIKKPYYLSLREFLKIEYSTKTIYPPMKELFSALEHTCFKDTKVVIIGQDPYINEGQAHGMAFSVKPTAKIPPSLINIFKELNTDVGCIIPNNGYLMKWANQGVMLLNTVLTVEASKSKSHAKKGWEQFTTFIIKKLNSKNEPIVFLLWGKDAQSKLQLINNPKHKVLVAAHPSPLAGGKFFGCKHFSKTNEFLKENMLKPIDWQIDDI